MCVSSLGLYIHSMSDEAISAPTPKWAQPDSTVTQRLVFFTDSMMVG